MIPMTGKVTTKNETKPSDGGRGTLAEPNPSRIRRGIRREYQKTCDCVIDIGPYPTAPSWDKHSPFPECTIRFGFFREAG
ncbi:hypothetical protein DAMNIGENAA_23300 [Desulforhabdus amnigena]|uniref:Uncharacterized protein n=1 Tax=Desulforhabdus amnigena TaxID=40218 RepID=A0A9W6FU37_9BACT|nr:hypothetical protein DAMNIGENAA_23300 [Desulforhabdus amnigena]